MWWPGVSKTARTRSCALPPVAPDRPCPARVASIRAFQRSFRDTRATCELSPQAGTSIEHSGKYWAPIRFWTGIPRRLSERGEEKSMCNLYSNTMPQDAMRRLFSAVDRLGNQAPLAAIFPDDEVPIVRIGTDGGRELVKARWGWDKTPRGWVTNARNLGTNWGVIRNVGQRCLVPATSFAEYHPSETIPGAKGNPIKAATWFRLAGEEDRPPFAFPGFYRHWNWKENGLRRKSDRELADVDAAMLAMTFLTCPPNRVVRPIHPQAIGHPRYTGGIRDLAQRQRRSGRGAAKAAPGRKAGNRVRRRKGGRADDVTCRCVPCASRWSAPSAHLWPGYEDANDTDRGSGAIPRCAGWQPRRAR